VRRRYDADTSPAGPELPPVEAIVTCPLEAEVIVTLDPATMNDVPSINCVNDPERPWLNFTAPVNVDPETVATTESFIDSDAVKLASVNTSPDEPETENILEFGRLDVVDNTK
jgi:hypothetical protein